MSLDVHKKKKKYFICIKEIGNEVPDLLITSIPCLSNPKESLACDLIYENERKKHRFGHKKYDKNSLTRFDLPSWSDCNGLKQNDKNLVFCPSPVWSYEGSWTLATSSSSSDGWLYSSKWSGPWKCSASFGSVVRQRLWYRIRSIRCPENATSPESREAHSEIRKNKNIDTITVSTFIGNFEKESSLPQNLQFFSSFIYVADFLQKKNFDPTYTLSNELLIGPRWTRYQAA